MKILQAALTLMAGLLVFGLPLRADTPAPHKLTIGVVPQQAATELARVWSPLLARLSSKTGYAIEFRTAQDISTFERRVEAGEFDFAYFNPLHYATYRTNGYQAIARERDTQLVGIVVIPQASQFKSLKDLNGVTMAFPSPTAFAATVLPQLSLKQLRVQVVPKYVSSHESVYRSVARGLYPAGGGIVKTFKQVDPAISDQLRILWKSDSYTPHPIAVHQRVSTEVARRVQDALIALSADTSGTALLKDAGFKGFVVAKDSDYEDIRRLQVSVSDLAPAAQTK